MIAAYIFKGWDVKLKQTIFKTKICFQKLLLFKGSNPNTKSYLECFVSGCNSKSFGPRHYNVTPAVNYKIVVVDCNTYDKSNVRSDYVTKNLAVCRFQVRKKDHVGV